MDKPNAGHGLACRTGYELAVARAAAWTLQVDSDGQCDPRYFAEFWQSRAEADVIFGLRTTRDDGFLRVLVSGGCRLATSLLSGVDLKDANVPYRLVRTGALQQALTRIPSDFDMQNVALTLALKRTALEICPDPFPRPAGRHQQHQPAPHSPHGIHPRDQPP